MDCISKETFIEGVVKFIDTEIMPKMQDGTLARWMVSGYMGTRMALDLSSWYDSNADGMKEYGIMDDGNRIDLGFLRSFAAAAFGKQPVLRISPSELFGGGMLAAILPSHIDFTAKDMSRLDDIFKAIIPEQAG